MNRNALLGRVMHLAREVLDEEHLDFKEADRIIDIEGWDSLNHMRMIVAMERHFGISFQSTDQMGISTVAELLDIIERRIVQA
jgi:acyl carrier protein